MKDYVTALEQAPDAERQRLLLERIITTPAVHARLVNTFSRMEYVGVRKLLKSRRSERLDIDGLQHILDETVHALRLKKAALALAAGAISVDTYAPDDTLAGDAGEDYLQGVDDAAETALADLPETDRTEINYLLTSAAIEVRAQAFYPMYERALRDKGIAMSVAAIMKDEDRHLGEMGEGLARLLPDWQARLERVLEAERELFQRFVEAVAGEAGTALSPVRASA